MSPGSPSSILTLWRPEHFDTAFLFLHSKQEVQIIVKNERALWFYESEGENRQVRHRILEATLSYDGTVTYIKPLKVKDSSSQSLTQKPRSILVGFTKHGKVGEEATLFFDVSRDLLAKVRRRAGNVPPRSQKGQGFSPGQRSLTPSSCNVSQYEYFDTKGAMFLLRNQVSARKCVYVGKSGQEVGQQAILESIGIAQKRVLRYHSLQSLRNSKIGDRVSRPSSKKAQHRTSAQKLEIVDELLKRKNGSISSPFGQKGQGFSPKSTYSSSPASPATKPINLHMIRSLSQTQKLRSMEKLNLHTRQKTLDLFTNLVLEDDAESVPSSSAGTEYYPIDNHWVTSENSVMDEFTFTSLLRKADECELNERRSAHIASNLRYCVLSSQQLLDILNKYPSLDDTHRVKIVSSARLADDNHWKEILYMVKDVRLRGEASTQTEFVHLTRA
mmetsp:Transcript_11406/g.42829  ORF Transcript_11406/g.42829 Transcript_11406/m.42829 type:complete len:444 (+) Transcript_11406:3-1334(+)